jgi:hypothetical protein
VCSMDNLRCFWFKVVWQISEHPKRSALLAIPSLAWTLFLGVAGFIQNYSGEPLRQWLQDNNLPPLMTLLAISFGSVLVLTAIVAALIAFPANSELEAIRPLFEKLTDEQKAILRWILPLGHSPIDIPQHDKDELERIYQATAFVTREFVGHYKVSEGTAKRVALLLKCDTIRKKLWYETPQNELIEGDGSRGLLQANTDKGTEAEPEQKPKPNIVMLEEMRLTPVTHNAEFLFSEELKAVADGRWGIVVEFQNRRDGEEIKSLRAVRSELMFTNKDGTLSHLVNPGFWFGPNNVEVDFERGDIHRLFVGFMMYLPETNQPYISTVDRRFTPPEPLSFSPDDPMSVRIALFTQTRHRFYKECEIELTPKLRVKKPFA